MFTLQTKGHIFRTCPMKDINKDKATQENTSETTKKQMKVSSQQNQL